MHCHWLLVMLALIVCRASALSLPKAALQSRVALRSSRSFSRHLAKAVPALNDEGGIDTDPPKRKTRTSKVSSSSGASGASEASTPGKAGTSAASHFSNRFDTLGSRLSSLQEGIHCTIFGEPVSLARHRVTRFGRMYNPSAPLQASFLKAFSPYIPPTPFAGPVAVRLDFYMSRLKKHYGTGKKANVLKENADSWHTKKPDVDNLVKFVLDALNGQVFADDSQVVSLSTSKAYTDSAACVQISVVPISHQDSCSEAVALLASFNRTLSL